MAFRTRCVCALTTQVLQDEIELPPRLEGVDQVHDEGMLHLLQDAPLGLRVRRVLGVADNHGLAGSHGAPNRQVSVMTSKRQALTRGKKKKKLAALSGVKTLQDLPSGRKEPRLRRSTT